MSGPELSAEKVIARLGFRPDSLEARYVAELSREPAPVGFDPLEGSAAWELLDRLGVSGEEAGDVVATLPDPERTPEWWWLAERAAGRLVAAMGEPDVPRGTWPAFEGPSCGPAERCHFTHVALLVVPHTLSYYERLGVSYETARASLSDIARHMAIHRRTFGVTGTEAAWWVTLCLRAEIVELGRLQYNRITLGQTDMSPLWYPPEEAERRGDGFRRGDPSLGVHIPESGPLRPDLVEESLKLAGCFFERFYPVQGRRLATCMSWLLDPQLSQYLSEESNIISFQRLFELVPGGYIGDRDVMQFVFRAPADAVLDSLPQNTSMERAAVAHIRAGQHWQVVTGWLELPS